jgi:Flp pilus assembly protein TadD
MDSMTRVQHQSNKITIKAALTLCLSLAGLIFAPPVTHADTRVSAEATLEPGATLSGNYLAGLVAGLQTDTAAASRFYTETLKFDPHSLDIAEKAFVTHLAEGHMADALRLADTIHARNSSNAIAKLVLAVNAIKTEQFTLARSLLKVKSSQRNSDLTATLISAWAWSAAGKADKGIDDLNRLAKDGPSRLFANIHSGLIMRLQGNQDEALRYFQSAYDGDPNSSLAAQFLGLQLSAMGRNSEAETVYKKNIQNFPRNVMALDALSRVQKGEKLNFPIKSVQDGVAEVLFDLGSAVSRDGDELSSIIYLRLATWLRPDYDAAKFTIAENYERMKQVQPASDLFADVSPSSPFFLAASIQQALDLEQLGQQERAISILETTQKKFPSNIDTLIAMGNVYRSRKDFQQSATWYSRAIKLLADKDPNYWSLYYSRGISYERLGQWPEAECDLRQALVLFPDQPLVLNYLGYSLVERNINTDEAFAMLRKAAEQRPTDGYIIDSLGWAYFHLGQYDKAVELLERAVQLRAADPTLNDHLGDIYWKMGRTREAQFQWNHARDLNPEPEDLPKILKKIQNGLQDGETPPPASSSPLHCG